MYTANKEEFINWFISDKEDEAMIGGLVKVSLLLGESLVIDFNWLLSTAEMIPPYLVGLDDSEEWIDIEEVEFI